MPNTVTSRAVVLALVILGVVLLVARMGAPAAAGFAARDLPEFTQSDPQAWINSPPLRRADLAGQVVLIDVWAFDCWNCYRSFPWMNELESRYRDRGLRVIGIHSPEFDHERRRSSVQAKMAEFGLEHAVMLDNDFAYWRALENRYWPTFYLVDRRGRLRARFVGETHSGDSNARAIESAIEALLAAPANL